MGKSKANQAEDGEHSLPALKMRNLELVEIVDIEAIQSLMDNFFKLTHIPIGLNDLSGNVLVGAGWQDICTKFHRVHPETCKHCVESDIKLSSGVASGSYKLYKCKNNMWDVVTPIIIEGQHVGNIFSGQFFFDDEPPDYELFRSQAKKYGFCEKEYIVALEKVPRLSSKTVTTSMAFFMSFASMVSHLSYSNIKLALALGERDVLVNTLRKSEEKYRNIIETTNEGIVIIDSKLRITYVNQKLIDKAGYTQEEVIGRLWWDFTDEEGKAIAKLHMDKRQLGIDETYELTLIRKDGSPFRVLVSSKSIIDKDGRFSGSLSMLTDITERKKAEEKLRESEEKYRNIVETANEGIIIIDDKATITFANHKMTDIFGYDVEEGIGRSLWDFISDENRVIVEKNMEKWVYGIIETYELKLTCKDGSSVWVLINSKPLFDKNGEYIGVMSMLTDITERKKAEGKIESLANIVESSNDAIITASLDGIIASWNKGAQEVYGYIDKEILGKNISIFEPDLLKGETKQLTDEIKKGKKVKHYETSRLKKDGTSINVSITLSPVFNTSGKFTAVSFISRDITEKKIAEKLLHGKEMAEVANGAKSVFLANMSHELRTPLNSIIGFSDMLHEQAYGDLNKKQLRAAGNISKSGRHLLSLINNILDISKVEAGKMELNYKSFELSSKLNMIQNLLSLIADRKNIKIEINTDSKLTSIYADEDKFIQVMYNLVDNAIKFSNENSFVKIGARKKGELVEISVKDTGIGIKTEDQNKLFKPFSQIDSFSYRKPQGTGLGLHLVKQIVHLHGGYVWFRSNLGEGSTFSFAIPINSKILPKN